MTLETRSYQGQGITGTILTECPLLKHGEPCGHNFSKHESRWKHFLDEHTIDDVPALSGGDR
ncbi:hypothetical protein ACFQH6_19310 [Halobacteriaceae archaeon GCM10025711]